MRLCHKDEAVADYRNLKGLVKRQGRLWWHEKAYGCGLAAVDGRV